MKVAVLMIGHIKQSLEIQNYHTLLNLFSKINCDLFVYTSKRYTFRVVRSTKTIESPEVDLHKFQSIYEKYIRKIIIEEYETEYLKKTTSDILKVLKKRMDKIVKDTKWSGRPLGPQNAKLLFINYLKDKYAEANNIKYDYVIVLRPEIIFKNRNMKSIMSAINTKNIVYGSEWFGMGPPNLMNMYCQKVLYYFKEYSKKTNKTIIPVYQDKIIIKNAGGKFVDSEILTVDIPYNSYRHISIKDIVNIYKSKNEKHFSGKLWLMHDNSHANERYKKKYVQVSDEDVENFRKKYKELFDELNN